MKREDGTFQIIALIVIASALALLLWNLTLRDVGAAPANVTCYTTARGCTA